MIILNDNIRINAGKPVDAKYLSSGNTAYTSTGATNTAITVPERHIGLTVNIMGVEYWYKNGVANTDLIEKKYDTLIPSGDFVTGATNIGFFSGFTGVQVLPITNLPDTNYNGNYYSIYNYYYRGTDGNIHIGVPSDGIPKRGYVKTAAPVKSWLWNEYTGSGNLLGWILVDGNISQELGTFQGGYLYYNGTTTFPYIQTSWTSGIGYNNGSNLVISTVLGSLTTGSTITIGGPVFAKKVNKILEFRTLQTKTPNLFGITFDEAFVYLSGATQVTQGANVGTGAAIFKQLTGTTLQFRRISGSGNTTVTQNGDTVVIFSPSGSSSGTTNAVNIGTGCGIFDAKVGCNLQFRSLATSGSTSISSDGATITISSHDTTAANIGTGCGIFTSKSGCCIQLRKLKPSGSTSISVVGDDLVIFSSGGSGGGLYNLSSPAAICVGGICCGTPLTGKTSFQLFEELLVPELFQTLVGTPTTSVGGAGGICEVGCSLSLTITPTYTAGAITLLYCSTSPFTRGGAANAYEYIGCCLPDTGFITNTSCSVSPYVVSAGTQTWCVRTRFNQGSCIKGSKGTVNPTYPTVCPASGCTAYGSTSLSGIYPYYYGKLTSGSRPPVTNSLVTTGCIAKCVLNSTGTVPINFNSSSSEYTWLAIPQSSASKTCWYVNALDNGNINSTPGDKYPDECIIAITSAESCWAGINYKVYMSGTVGAISATICFRNS